MDSLRINFDNNAGFGKLDPATSRSTATNNILLNIFQGLYRFVGRELVPAVAESVDVKEHHQEFIFHLRETCWSDGKPVVAQDFYYAWLRVIQNPDAPARRFFSYIQNVDSYWSNRVSSAAIGLEAVNDRTLRVKLQSVCPFFLSLTASAAFLPIPSHRPEQMPWISNGPYVLGEFQSHRAVLIPQVKGLERICLTCQGDEKQIEEDFSHHRIHVSDGIPQFRFDEHQRAGHVAYLDELGTFFLQFQCERVSRSLRRQIQSVLDVDSLAAHAKVGEGRADTYVPWKFFNEVSPIPPRRLEILPVEEYPPLTLLTNNLHLYVELAEQIKKQIEDQTDLTVQLKSLEWEDFLQCLSQGNFDLALNGWVADYPDPVALLEIWQTGSSFNFSRFSHPEFDHLLQKSASVGTHERMQLLQKAECLLSQELPFVAIYHYRLPLMKHPEITGLQASPFGVFNLALLKRSEFIGR